jgi:carboxylesterase
MENTQNPVKMAENGVKRIFNTVKGALFADPELLYKEERQLVNQPFHFQGTNGKGVLLIHGWTSTPYEVRRLGKYLNENGYTAVGIQLRGHGTVPKDLEDVKWTEWISDMEKAYQKLKSECPKVYVAGTSIGSNLAMIFATKHPEINGLVLMATPYKLRIEKTALLFAKILSLLKKRYNRKFYPPTFGVSTTITRLIAYKTYPIKSALETFNLVKKSRENISQISNPCFLLQSSIDHIVSRDSMEKIYALLGSKIKKKKYIDKAYHTFISDIKNEHVFEDILQFLNEN